MNWVAKLDRWVAKYGDGLFVALQIGQDRAGAAGNAGRVDFAQFNDFGRDVHDVSVHPERLVVFNIPEHAVVHDAVPIGVEHHQYAYDFVARQRRRNHLHVR